MGEDDPSQLETATRLRAVLATQNLRDFEGLHYHWQAHDRRHAGILLTPQHLPLRSKIEWLERAARLLSPEIARNQLMLLRLFDTERRARAYVTALAPLAPGE